MEIIFNYLNWLDLVIIVVVLKTTFFGFGGGIITDIFSVLFTYISLVVCLNFYTLIADYLGKYLSTSNEIGQPIAFLLLLIIAWIATKLLKKFISTFFEKPAENTSVNRLTYAFFGFIKGIIISGILIIWLMLWPSNFIHNSITGTSLFARKLIEIFLFAYNRTTQLYNGNPIEVGLFI